MEQVVDPVPWLIPVFLLCAIIEIAADSRRRSVSRFKKNDLLTSAVLGLGCGLSNVLFAGFAAMLVMAAVGYRPWEVEQTWWSWVLAMILVDIAYYFGHRIAHKLRIFWATHSVHHSSHHFNFMVGFRNGWTGFVYPTALIKLLILAAGFSLEQVVIATAINIAYQFMLHTESVPKLPRWIEIVFNTPTHHRVHHAKNPAYLDKNFGGILIVWDRMFGTFADLDPEDPPRFGLVDERPGDRFVTILLTDWHSILKDLRVARSPKCVLKRCLFVRDRLG